MRLAIGGEISQNFINESFLDSNLLLSKDGIIGKTSLLLFVTSLSRRPEGSTEIMVSQDLSLPG